MPGQIINVISAPNASDADAATYTTGASTPNSIVFNDGVVILDDLTSDYGSTSVTDWSYDGSTFRIDGRGGLLDAIAFHDASPASQGTTLEMSRLGNNFYITEGTLHQPAGATIIRGNPVPPDGPTPVIPTPPVTPPATPQYVAVHDTTTSTDLPDTFSSAYTGPVSGISTQSIAITPDSLAITALTDNTFIKTSAGNDAIALHGGSNVVDSGTGSNFITSGGGADTIFLDCRNIPAAASAAGPVPGAIWDTIQNFGGHGAAATLWGLTPGTALSWQKNEGAVGHTGLTLHANLPNGAEASLTLAGIDSKASLQLSYGSTGGASYLYVKSV